VERIHVLEQRLSLARDQMQIAMTQTNLPEIRSAQARVARTLQVGESVGGAIMGPDDV
jgi:hypothetical protein